jgi:hypothetical protein
MNLHPSIAMGRHQSAINKNDLDFAPVFFTAQFGHDILFPFSRHLWTAVDKVQ